MLDTIRNDAAAAMQALIDVSKLQPGDLVVVGCSSSEVCGHKIGTDSSPRSRRRLWTEFCPCCAAMVCSSAAQCCEHLGRALILESEAAAHYHLARVNVIPQPKAGGSFATAAYAAFEHPVAVETLHAQASCRS